VALRERCEAIRPNFRSAPADRDHDRSACRCGSGPPWPPCRFLFGRDQRPTQYALAIDRQNPELASEADSLHPAVLRLIAMTVEAHGPWPLGRRLRRAGGRSLRRGLLVGLGVGECR
jgi:phosphocarrier protein FPr